MKREQTGSEHSVADRRRSERQLWRKAFVLSAVLHVLLFLLWPSTWLDRSLAPTDGQSGPRGTLAEGGAMHALAPRSAPPDARQPPPVPTIELDLIEEIDFDPDAFVEVDLTVPELPEPGRGDTDGADDDDGGAGGPAGDAGAGAAGAGGDGTARTAPPSPQRLIPPPSHRDLRGREVTIRVFVDETGRVVPDSTRLEPVPSSDGLREHLIQEASGWQFRPALREGVPVEAWWSLVAGG